MASLCSWRKTQDRWSSWKALMGLKLKRESPSGGLRDETGWDGVRTGRDGTGEGLTWFLINNRSFITVSVSYFLDSSICSTSLDSSTTFPLIMVWVTTLTIFLVRTSGSSVERNSESQSRKASVIRTECFFNTQTWEVCVAKDVLLCFAALLRSRHLICH